MTKPVYHVRHDLQPRLTLELLLLLASFDAPCTADEISARAIQRGSVLAERSPAQLLASLGNLKIIRRDIAHIRLTTLGQNIAHTVQERPRLLADLIHFQYMTLYNPNDPSTRFSWAYRTVCDDLWTQGTCVVNAHRLVVQVQEAAFATFAGAQEAGVSFSRDSVSGVIHWLEALAPPVVTTQQGVHHFARRLLCPPEAFIRMLYHVSRNVNPDDSRHVRLTPDLRQKVSRLCMVDETGFDTLLEQATIAYDVIVRQSERGQWLTLPAHAIQPFNQ